MSKFEKETQKDGISRNVRGSTDDGGSALVHVDRPQGAGMLNAKCIAILAMYSKNLELYVGSPAFDANKIKHMQTMVPKATAFFEGGRREKGFRWLGFIQGALWAEGIYSIEDLKEHNRPDMGKEEEKEE